MSHAAPPQFDARFSFDRLVGRSPELRHAIDVARRIARARASTVLLVGETGTGKELFARGIHYEGPDGSAPFVAINCAAIPETLLESELFGHEAGAFTGARARKMGLMELAGCGSLFLDEIHHLPLALQAKLLRALEERRIRRLGGLHEITINCRVIASTNLAIEQAVEDGSFREDVFYRLNVLRVDVPPLRDRRGDVELLARHFLSELTREYSHAPKELTPDALMLLRGHTWPGNVRELKNVMERAFLVSGATSEIEASHTMIQRRVTRPGLGADPGTGGKATLAGEIEIPLVGKTLRDIEREAVQLTLHATGGNQSKAARLLGISRPTLAKIMRESQPRPLELVSAG